MQFINFIYKHKIIFSLIITGAIFAFFYLPVSHAMFLASIITCITLLICLHYHDIIRAIHNAFSRPTPIPSSPSAEAWLATIKAWRARPDSILMVEATQFRTLEEQKTFIVGLVDILSEDTAEPVSQAINSSIIRTLTAALSDERLALDDTTCAKIRQAIQKAENARINIDRAKPKVPDPLPTSTKVKPDFEEMKRQVRACSSFCKNHYYTLQAKSLDEQRTYIKERLSTVEDDLIDLYLSPPYQTAPDTDHVRLAKCFIAPTLRSTHLHPHIDREQLYQLGNVNAQTNYLKQQGILTQADMDMFLQPLYLQETPTILTKIATNTPLNMAELGELDQKKYTDHQMLIEALNQEKAAYITSCEQREEAISVEIDKQIRALLHHATQPTSEEHHADWLKARKDVAQQWHDIEIQLAQYYLYKQISATEQDSPHLDKQSDTIEIIGYKIEEIDAQLNKVWPKLISLLPKERKEQIAALDLKQEDPKTVRGLLLYYGEKTDDLPVELINEQAKATNLLINKFQYEQQQQQQQRKASQKPKKLMLEENLFWRTDVASNLAQRLSLCSTLPAQQQWEKIQEALQQYRTKLSDEVEYIHHIHRTTIPYEKILPSRLPKNRFTDTILGNFNFFAQFLAQKNRENQMYNLSAMMIFCLLTLASLIVVFKVFAAHQSIMLTILTITLASLTCYGLITTGYNLHYAVVQPSTQTKGEKSASFQHHNLTDSKDAARLTEIRSEKYDAEKLNPHTFQ